MKMASVQQALEQIPVHSVVNHTLAGGSVVAIILNWLPPVLALLGAMAATTYYCICVWESRTVQHAVNNWRMKRRARKVLRLRAKAKVVAAQLEALEKVRLAKREAREMVEQASVDAAIEAADAEVKLAAKVTPV